MCQEMQRIKKFHPDTEKSASPVGKKKPISDMKTNPLLAGVHLNWHLWNLHFGIPIMRRLNHDTA